MANLTREERLRRETDANNNIDGTAFQVDNSNPREPVVPVREGAHPVTPAAGALAVGTPGTADPVDSAKVEAEKHEAAARVPMFPVKLKRGYWAKDGSGKIAEGETRELPIEEARYLIESGIAERADDLPAV